MVAAHGKHTKVISGANVTATLSAANQDQYNVAVKKYPTLLKTSAKKLAEIAAAVVAAPAVSTLYGFLCKHNSKVKSVPYANTPAFQFALLKLEHRLAFSRQIFRPGRSSSSSICKDYNKIKFANNSSPNFKKDVMVLLNNWLK